ncbi:MAG TPA: MraY family glycosyltransferase [Halanaerobiales bacterium]|nr:MraY family glycosyltransferase [Halanaerobiales bacterium]
MISSYILIFFSSLIISFFLVPGVKKVAKKIDALDYPGARRINELPVPNIGGLAIWASFLLTAFIFFEFNKTLFGILLGGSFITFVGFVDDLYDISPFLKLVFQILAAVVLLFFGVQIEFITNPLGGMFFLGSWGIPLTIIWVVSITNVVNLMDGLDGLAAGVSIIAVITIFFVSLQEGQNLAAVMALTLAGSSFGFLYYNFHPAEIFMGDSGSMFLGYTLASISVAGSLKSATAITLVVPVLALGVPILDTLFAIIRRAYNGKPIGKADNGHIHHRLLALGWNQQEATLIVYGISIFLGIIAVIFNSSTFENGLLLIFLAFLTIIFGAWKLGIFSAQLKSDKTEVEKTKY